MDEKFKKFILEKILNKSGIVIAPVHASFIASYVEKQLLKLNMTIEEYCLALDSDNDLLDDLINKATTNETYFFRESKQFDYLKDVLFPSFSNKKLVVWSAACSSGEEPLSILALALRYNINITIYASDIDDNVLAFFKRGVYSKYSFRSDGKKYHPMLELMGDYDKDKTHFIFRPDILKRINIIKYNLTDFNNFPIKENIDIIFMRNVFIYFDTETRKKITDNVARHLNDNGHLFYSINEIGNINGNIVPPGLKKENYDQVYFFVKQKDSSSHLVQPKRHNIYIKPCDVFHNMDMAITRHDFDGALKIAFEYNPIFADRNYSSFFKGYIYMMKKDFSSAEKYFITSEFINDNFWPVYYYHGIMSEEVSSNDKARYCFKKCVELIKKDTDSEEYKFLFKNTSLSSLFIHCTSFLKDK